ncbi:unnamed protein product [Anisakis simplex]|uniref:Probable RNA-binding protein 19 (inferred by orthology to a human protein) n=1 Tax=Anisakis simplex TaxID=6269 RepID=A0A0M3JFP3_ANISI|nr:unnamed protein product [Anisakis simplex]
MDNSNEAKMAFKALAYSRFRSQPLYLEWAPFDVFASRRKDDEMVDEKSSNEAVVSNEGRKTESVENTEEAVQDESMTTSQRGSSLSADEKKKLRRSKKHRQLDTDEVTVKQEESEESRVEESKIAQLPGYLSVFC